MNKSIVIAIFLGLVSAEAPVWSLQSVQDHRDDAAVQKGYGEYSTKQANGRPPYQSAAELESESESDVESDAEAEVEAAADGEPAAEPSSSDSDSDSDAAEKAAVQVMGDDEEEDHSKEFFAAFESAKDEGAPYTRVIPDRFSSDADDLFMRSMINTYALEGKNKDGSPNGNFVMDEPGTRAAAAEVLSTHKGLKGAALQKYLAAYFPKAWAHFDVNRGGKVEVIKMPQFMRFLASDQTMSLGE